MSDTYKFLSSQVTDSAHPTIPPGCYEANTVEKITRLVRFLGRLRIRTDLERGGLRVAVVALLCPGLETP